MRKGKKHKPLHLVKEAPHHMRYKDYNTGYHLRRVCCRTALNPAIPFCFWHTVTFHGHHSAYCHIPLSPQCILPFFIVTRISHYGVEIFSSTTKEGVEENIRS